MENAPDNGFVCSGGGSRSQVAVEDGKRYRYYSVVRIPCFVARVRTSEGGGQYDLGVESKKFTRGGEGLRMKGVSDVGGRPKGPLCC